ncbi:MAG: hypothetical protein QG635_1585 [Bacteroidota bacterium]|nr:hypothetical protein [Bacteroidota bacterium]
MARIENVFITGASSGIGRALAIEAARRGADLVLASRNTESLTEISSFINKHYNKAYWIKCDVCNTDEFRTASDFAREKLGHIGLAILNAGISKPVWFDNLNSNDLRETFETNLFGIVNGLEFLVPIMKKQGGGAIAGVGSLAESRSFPGVGAYTGSKAAVAHILEAARLELRHYGIDIITVKPGFVRTNMTAKNKFFMPFLMDTQPAAKIILDGIEKGKSIVAFPGFMSFISNLGKIVPYQFFDKFAQKWRKSN